MKWEGLIWIEIVEFMLDLKRNGGRIYYEVMEYFIEYELVLWVWELGIDVVGNFREFFLVFVDEYIEVVKVWFEEGVVILVE